MSSPKDWRNYERHPISARYPDIKGQAWEDFLANLTKRKVRGRSITIYEGKILDGWQLYRACLEEDIEPTFKVLREGEDPEEFVEEANEHRRHETPQAMCDRARARRDRVWSKRMGGASIRTIAEEEGVDPKTVQRDLAESGVAPATPEQNTAKITGNDGKSYPRNGPTKRKPKSEKSGAVKFDWRQFYHDVTLMVTHVARVEKVYQCGHSKAAKEVRDALHTFYRKLVELVEFHSKEKAPSHTPGF